VRLARHPGVSEQAAAEAMAWPFRTVPGLPHSCVSLRQTAVGLNLARRTIMRSVAPAVSRCRHQPGIPWLPLQPR